MEMKDFNLEFLVSIELRDKKLASWYKFKEETIYRDWIGNWGKKIIKKSGVYDCSVIWDEFICSLEDFNKSKLVEEYLLINKQMYYKPIIILKFVNGDKKIIRFNTIEEAHPIINNIKNKYTMRWLNSEINLLNNNK